MSYKNSKYQQNINYLRFIYTSGPFSIALWVLGESLKCSYGKGLGDSGYPGRRTLDIDLRDPLEIYVDGESILLKKYTPACIICGEMGDLVEYRGKQICRKCIGRF